MKYLARGIGGLLIGTICGCLLFSMIAGFFGETWSVEAGGPWIVIISPILVPALTGAFSAMVGGIGKSIVFSLLSSIAYLIIGVGIIIVGGFVQAGWAGITLGIVILAALCPTASVVFIIFDF